MKICTSIGPNRIERQQECISSWIKIGCSVTSVQSVGEANKLKQLYPEVDFIETNLIGDVFRKHNMVRISSLLQQATNENILILNSDVEIRTTEEKFKKYWHTVRKKELKVGIRWDENTLTREAKLLKYGIDAFLITPEMVSELEDIGMTIGCPAWDYWIPIQLQRKGYSITTSKSIELVHELHDQNWSKAEFAIGVSLLKKHYGLDIKAASKFILQVTGRENLQ